MIRKLIYTTNTVEGYHRQIQKMTKNKGVFPNDSALEKFVYLAYRTHPQEMDHAVSQLGGHFATIGIKSGEIFLLTKICARWDGWPCLLPRGRSPTDEFKI